MMDADEAATRAEALFERIRPLLGGEGPEVQGAVLVQCLSLWIAGHYPAGQPAMSLMLALHVEAVRKMIPVDIEMLKARKS